MDEKRKAEVNRRLHHFLEVEKCGMDFGEDFTADLNALGRVEAKLPQPLGWEIHKAKAGVAVLLIAATDHQSRFTSESATEAEARADAICRYLESR
jgi:hypothetical protein